MFASKFPSITVKGGTHFQPLTVKDDHGRNLQLSNYNQTVLPRVPSETNILSTQSIQLMFTKSPVSRLQFNQDAGLLIL
jgi:hypothetical protein